MSDTTLSVRLLHSYKTEAQWAQVSDIPKLGEVMYTSGGTHDGFYKIGDGTHTWSELSYVSWADNVDWEKSIAASSSYDSTPYSYRATPDISANSRAYSKIVGGTLGWNQMAQIDDFTAPANEQTVKYSDISGYISGHKYLGMITQMDSMASNTRNTLRVTTSTSIYQSTVDNYHTAAGEHLWIFSMNESSTTASFGIWVHTPNVDVRYKNAMLFDLTQMLGSTIADYLYTIESATAGAGIAKLREWGIIDGKYHAYSAGKLESVNVSGIETVGFNQWDEVLELGQIDQSTGDNVASSTFTRSKNYQPCLPNTQYYFTTLTSATNLWCNFFFYDKDKNYISYKGAYSPNSNGNAGFGNPFTSPTNAYYFRMVLTSAYGTSYKNDICINISDTTRNGTYEPYSHHSIPLDSDLTLNGIYKLDASNNLYADGDVYESDGTVTRKYGLVDLGTLTWTYLSSVYNSKPFVAAIPGGAKIPSASRVIIHAVCVAYSQVAPYLTNTAEANKVFAIGHYFSGDKEIQIVDNSYTDAATFKTAMNGVYLVYELATPTTESADPFTNPHRVEAGGTESIVDASVTAGTRDIAVPMGHESKYVPNTGFNIDIPEIPSNVSSFANDAGYLTASTATDTKNTAGSTNSTSKLYLVGAASQAANPQTYSNSDLYYYGGLKSAADGSAGVSHIIQNTASIQIYVNDEDSPGTQQLYLAENVASLTNNGVGISINDSGGTSITGVVTPTANGMAANKKYVDDSVSGVTYSISMSNNVITLTGPNGSTSAVTLPVYNGGVS